MTARWQDTHYDGRKPGRLQRALDRLADWLYPVPTDPLADAVRREAMIAHPSNQGATAGEAPRPTHGTAGRGANHLCESPSRTALGVTVAFLAIVALVLAAVSCDPNPATSLGCADDSCEVGP